MEVFRFSIFPMAEIEKREAFKEAINNCPVCNQVMVFNHEMDYLTNTLHEVAYCQECKMHVREEDFALQ